MACRILPRWQPRLRGGNLPKGSRAWHGKLHCCISLTTAVQSWLVLGFCSPQGACCSFCCWQLSPRIEALHWLLCC